jgi:transposase
MWESYLKVVHECCSDALHILDRFHIVAKMNKTLDEVRAEESRRMKHKGQEPVLKKIAHSLRENPELIINYFRAQKLLPAAIVEGFNNKAKVTTRKSYGFRIFRVLELALSTLLSNALLSTQYDPLQFPLWPPS